MNTHDEFQMADKKWTVCEHKCTPNKMLVHKVTSRMDDAFNNEDGKVTHGIGVSQKGISRLLLSNPFTTVDFYNKSR